MRLAHLAVIASLALTCGVAQAASLPAGAAVLPGSAVGEMLHQCSRGAPARGEATWQPGARDIRALEAMLPRALTAARPSRDPTNWAAAPSGWRRQYVGIVLTGKRLIYGNFFPGDAKAEWPSWRRRPMIVCDGGPRFFGVVYDVAARRIVSLDFNGRP